MVYETLENPIYKWMRTGKNDILGNLHMKSIEIPYEIPALLQFYHAFIWIKIAYGGCHTWGYPLDGLFDIMENPMKKWMKTGGIAILGTSIWNPILTMVLPCFDMDKQLGEWENDGKIVNSIGWMVQWRFTIKCLPVLGTERAELDHSNYWPASRSPGFQSHGGTPNHQSHPWPWLSIESHGDNWGCPKIRHI